MNVKVINDRGTVVAIPYEKIVHALSEIALMMAGLRHIVDTTDAPDERMIPALALVRDRIYAFQCQIKHDLEQQAKEEIKVA